jgi:hypothetical protein
MQPDQIKINLYYLMLFGVAIGIVLGLVPFILGRKRGKRSLGLIALVLCVISGAFLPILSLLISIGFTVAILVTTSAAKSDESPAS